MSAAGENVVKCVDAGKPAETTGKAYDAALKKRREADAKEKQAAAEPVEGKD